MPPLQLHRPGFATEDTRFRAMEQTARARYILRDGRLETAWASESVKIGLQGQ